MMFLFAVLMAMVACGPVVEDVYFHVNRPGRFSLLRLLHPRGSTFDNIINDTHNGFDRRKFLFSIQAYISVSVRSTDEH